MAVNPIDPTNTARVYIDYTSYGIGHTLLFRLGLGATALIATPRAAAAANILKERMFNGDSFTAARFAEKGAHFSLPITFTPVVGVIDSSVASNQWSEDPESAFISLVGRGQATGRRTRWEFFTAVKTTAWPLKNRYPAGLSAPIDTLRLNWTAFVEAAGVLSDAIVTIAGDRPLVYGYVNIAKNGYWQRQQR